ncbi:MAG: hypothetical protein GY913_21100 [Proteobacteria bacterium]|nr:hypothetical protein [Pseudomonadota bacterium]MCP4919406.1 hypothetical protein [Pseudomonadota bacterium]
MMWLWLACTAGQDDAVSTDSGPGVSLPAWVSLPEVTSSGEHGEGDVVTGLIGDNQSAVLVFDRAGEPIWAYENGDQNVPSWSKFTDSGDVIHNHHYRDREAAQGEVLVSSIGGSTITTAVPQHHHAALLIDGTVYYLRVEFVEMQVNGQDVTVAMDELVAKPLGGVEETVLFSFEKDYSLRPFPHCSHWDDSIYYRSAKDWSHANSLAYDEEDDAILLVARHLDVVMSIDRGGAGLNWELGGLQSGWTLEGGTGFNHPHLSSFHDDQLVMFDNGDHKDPAVSRVVVYDLDRENRIYTQTREILDPRGELNELMGDAQILPSGNLLVSWSEMGRIEEIAPDDSVVWSLQMPLGTITGRTDTTR